MTPLSDDAKAIIAVAAQLGDRTKPSLSPTAWHQLARKLSDSGLTPGDLFRSTEADLSGVDPAMLTRLIDSAPAALLEVEELSRRGLWLTTLADDDYPSRLRHRLGHHAPPVLFGAGAADLLTRPGIGIVGSRSANPAGAEVAQALATEAVRLGCTVVSGAARGMDQLAVNAAHEADGSVVGFLADSLLSRIRSADVLQALDAGRTCLVTAHHPAEGFTPSSVMGRNKLIYGLSALSVVVASGHGSGGTWAGANEALANDFGPVVVWRGAGEGSGNAALQRAGMPALEDVSDVERLLRTSSEVASPSQLSLLE